MLRFINAFGLKHQQDKLIQKRMKKMLNESEKKTATQTQNHLN